MPRQGTREMALWISGPSFAGYHLDAEGKDSVINFLKRAKRRIGKVIGVWLERLWACTGVPWLKRAVRRHFLRKDWFFAAALVSMLEALLIIALAVYGAARVALHSDSWIEIAAKTLGIVYLALVAFVGVRNAYGDAKREAVPSADT